LQKEGIETKQAAATYVRVRWDDSTDSNSLPQRYLSPGSKTCNEWTFKR
jgi:hypothetical protein